jgi:hypothetical protein
MRFTKHFANIICKQCQLNFVFVHIVEYADVLANDGNRAILHGFIEEPRVFNVNEVVIQYVHDGIALIVELVQVGNALGNGLTGGQTIRSVRIKLAKPNVGAQLVGQLQ